MRTLYNFSCHSVNNDSSLNNYNIGCNFVGMRLGERIKKARLEAGMTQRQLAKESGVKQQMISRLEVGRAFETSDIVPLARALGVSPDWLNSGIGSMRPNQKAQNYVMHLAHRISSATPEQIRAINMIFDSGPEKSRAILTLLDAKEDLRHTKEDLSQPEKPEVSPPRAPNPK